MFNDIPVSLPSKFIFFTPEDEDAYSALLLRLFPNLRFADDLSWADKRSEEQPDFALYKSLSQCRSWRAEVYFDAINHPPTLHREDGKWHVKYGRFPNGYIYRSRWRREAETRDGVYKPANLERGEIVFRAIAFEKDQLSATRRALALVKKVATNTYFYVRPDRPAGDPHPVHGSMYWLGNRAIEWARGEPTGYFDHSSGWYGESAIRPYDPAAYGARSTPPPLAPIAPARALRTRSDSFNCVLTRTDEAAFVAALKEAFPGAIVGRPPTWLEAKGDEPPDIVPISGIAPFGLQKWFWLAEPGWKPQWAWNQKNLCWEMSNTPTPYGYYSSHPRSIYHASDGDTNTVEAAPTYIDFDYSWDRNSPENTDKIAKLLALLDTIAMKKTKSVWYPSGRVSRASSSKLFRIGHDAAAWWRKNPGSCFWPMNTSGKQGETHYGFVPGN